VEAARYGGSRERALKAREITPWAAMPAELRLEFLLNLLLNLPDQSSRRRGGTDSAQISRISPRSPMHVHVAFCAIMQFADFRDRPKTL
jgi:hypothetical protein